MSPASGYYYDGRYALRHKVGILLVGNRLKVVGTDVNGDFDARQVHVSTRIANTPRWLYLPDGGVCVIDDNDFANRWTRESALERTLHRWESRPIYAVLAVALVALSLWLLVDRGLPVVVERIAEQIPASAEITLGTETLAFMDQRILKPSDVPADRQSSLRAKFNRMAQAGGVTHVPRLEFRYSEVIGPNAFALPSGIIVVTDEIVNVAGNDREIMAVLAHELGHVEHRDTMRQLLQGSATALIIAGVTGDIASTTSLAAAAPTMLLYGKYSRAYEREADAYGLDLLQRAHIAPRNFASILKRLKESSHKQGPDMPDFLSSHPQTEEREALALQANADAADSEDDDEDDTDKQMQAKTENKQSAADIAKSQRQLATLNPEQLKLVELLDGREYAELERSLNAYLTAFDGDSTTSVKLETAFRSFYKAPGGLEPRLDEWTAQQPNSYAAAVARGNYYIARALDARGTKYIGKTPQASLDKMQGYFRRARMDLDRSFKLTQKPYLTHRYLFTIALNQGSRDEQRLQYEQALRWAPQSLETRLSYMTSLEPRWGGSIEKMQAFVAQSRNTLQDQKAIDRLAARIPAYRGFAADQENDYAHALAYFDEALKLDPNNDTLCDRARALGGLKRYDEALPDAARAFHDSHFESCQSTLIYLSGQASKPDEVIEAMGSVIAVDPNSYEALNQRGWRYMQAGKPAAAFPDYLKAAQLGSAWAQREVAKLYWQGSGVAQNRDESIVWMRKVAEQGDPADKRVLDRALAEMGRK